VSLGFFDDILIPPEAMKPSTVFNEAEQVWVWNYQGNDLYIDLQEVLFVLSASIHHQATHPAMTANQIPGSRRAVHRPHPAEQYGRT
jgi:DNA-directed RNA polymerase III subunit RPC8